jgi:hypothetical protein
MNFREIFQSLWTTSPQLNYLALRKKIRPFPKFSLQHKSRSDVFVLSTGRTGTLTLARVFALSKDYLVFHEPSPKLYGLSKLCYIKSPQEHFLDVFGEAFIAAREFLLNLSAELGKNYIETSPQTTFLARAIHKVLPDAKFIHVVRDPRAVVRSMMRRKWYGGNPYDKFRISPESGQPYHDKWYEMKIFEKNIWLWAETNRWIMDFTSTLPDEKKLFVKAEEIFLAKEDALKRLFEFIDSPQPSKKKILKIIRKKLNQQLAGDFPDSMLWTFEMNDHLNKIANPTASELGYTLQ